MSFFQAIQTRKMCFTIFQKKKTPFQPIKTRGSKSRKIEIFPKGLTLGFGQKMTIFPCLFSGNIGQEDVFYNIPKKKTPFQPIKTTGSKSRKIQIFAKGLTHGFGQKMAIFPCLFFRQYRPRKFVLQYSRARKSFLAYKNNRFKKSKN